MLLLAQLLGEPLKAYRLPLDWLIVPIRAGASFIADGLPLPHSAEELEPSRNSGSMTAVWWPARRFYFWHDFATEDRTNLDMPNGFPRDIEMYRQLRENFLRLREKRRRIFVLSNSQNNISFVERQSGRIDFTLTEEKLAQMQAALDGCFGGLNELIVVTYPDRATASAIASRWAPAVLEPDDSSWFGNDEAWARIFTEKLGPLPIAPQPAGAHSVVPT